MKYVWLPRCVGLLILAASQGALSSTAVAAPLTLRECLDAAVENSPDLSSSRHLIEASRADIIKKRGTVLPYLSAQTSGYVLNGQPVNQFSVLNIFNAATGSASHSHASWDPLAIEQFLLTYPLFYEGSIMGLNDPPAVVSAEASMTQQQAIALVAEQKVRYSVIAAFLNVASYADQLELQENVVAKYQQQFGIVEAQQGFGLKLPKDVDIARAQVDSARDAEESLRQSMFSNKVQLAALIGRGDGGRALEIDRAEPVLLKLPPLDEFLAQVMPNNPALLVDQAKIEVARQQERVDKVGQWPVANLNTDFSTGQDLEHFNGSSRFPRPVLYESYITITLPLFDFGQRAAAHHESDESLAAAKDQLKATAETIRTSITQTYNEIDGYVRTIAGLNASYVELEREAALARAHREAGVTDELNLVVAELASANARIAVENEELLERLQYAALQNLAGGNWHWVE